MRIYYGIFPTPNVSKGAYIPLVRTATFFFLQNINKFQGSLVGFGGLWHTHQSIPDFFQSPHIAQTICSPQENHTSNPAVWQPNSSRAPPHFRKMRVVFPSIDTLSEFLYRFYKDGSKIPHTSSSGRCEMQSCRKGCLLMKCYDEQLRQLQAQCARKKKLEASIDELRAQRKTYADRADELRKLLADEQADVERLEGRSLAAFFYQMIGKMDEKLTKEQQEAYAAQVKYDAAARELEGIERDLKRCEDERNSLWGCEARYDAVLQEKTLAVKAAGGPTAEKMLQLEERSGYLGSQKRELQEAMNAGNAALSCADQILSELNSAEGWGTWDLVGGGLLTDLAKHSHLDQAQASVETLQTQLRCFKTELADVTIDADIQVSIDGFLRVADYFFDGIFADWAVLDQIHQSQQQVQRVRNQIESVLNHLHTLMHQTDAELSRISREIEQLVAGISM